MKPILGLAAPKALPNLKSVFKAAILIIKIVFFVLQRRRRCNTQNWFQNENYCFQRLY
jgi:hypothetical protein